MKRNPLSYSRYVRASTRRRLKRRFGDFNEVVTLLEETPNGFLSSDCAMVRPLHSYLLTIAKPAGNRDRNDGESKSEARNT